LFSTSGEKVDPVDYFKRLEYTKISPQHYQGGGSLPFSLPHPQVSPLNPLPQYDNTPSENQDPTKVIPLLTSTVIKSSTMKVGQNNTKNNNTSDIEMAPPPLAVGKSARQRILRSQIESPITPR
jgi:hypothetical protein